MHAKDEEAGRLDLVDFVTYEIAPDTEHPQIQNEGMRYEGLRCRTECRLAGKLSGQRFGVNVAFGDPILEEPEIISAEDALAFAGVDHTRADHRGSGLDDAPLQPNATGMRTSVALVGGVQQGIITDLQSHQFARTPRK